MKTIEFTKVNLLRAYPRHGGAGSVLRIFSHLIRRGGASSGAEKVITWNREMPIRHQI